MSELRWSSACMLPVGIVAEGFDRVERKAAHEHPEQAEDTFLRRRQEAVAPPDRVAQGALPGRGVARAVREHWQSAVEAGQQGTRRQQPNAGGRQFQG